MKKLAIILLIATFGFAGCKKDDPSPKVNNNSIDGIWVLTDRAMEYHNSSDQIVHVQTSNPKIVFEFKDGFRCIVNGTLRHYSLASTSGKTVVTFSGDKIGNLGNKVEVTFINQSGMGWLSEEKDIAFSDRNNVDQVAPKVLIYSNLIRQSVLLL